MLLELLDDDAEPLCDDEELLREVVELPPLDWAKLLAGATMTAAANATDKACLIMSFISFWVLICISPCLKKSAKLLSPFKNVHSSLPQRRMVPPVAAVAATRSASDSVFRCRKEDRLRLQNATTPRLQ